jgi:hypothetical protein
MKKTQPKLEMHIHPNAAHVRDGGELSVFVIFSDRKDEVDLRIFATHVARALKMRLRRFDASGEEIKR